MGKDSTKKKQVNGIAKKPAGKSKTLKVAKGTKSKPKATSDSLMVTKTFKVYKNQKDCFLDNKKY
jgi:cystathionine gamma-lyase